MTPRVSVWTSVRNARRFVARNIGALFDQTFLSWECFYIDDASEDGTLEEAMRVGGNDLRFTFLTRTFRVGKVGSFLATLPFLRGEIIVEYDGDDFFSSLDALQTIVSAYDRDPDLEATYGQNIDSTTSASSEILKDSGKPRFMSRHDAIFTPRSVKRSVLLKAFQEMPEVFYESPGVPWRSAGDLAIFGGPVLHLAQKIKWLEGVLYTINRSNPLSDHLLDSKLQGDCARGIIELWRKLENEEPRI